MGAPGTQTSAFGRLEQCELEYLRLLAFDPLDRLLFAVLKVRYDARKGTVTDRIETLANWTGMSPRRVQYCLNSLAKRGLLIRARHRGVGGPRGHAWSWSSTVLAYADWPTEPFARHLIGLVAYVATFYPVRPEGAGRASSSTKSTHQTKEEDAQNEGRGRTATRDNQESSLDSSQERDASFDLEDEEARRDRGSLPLGTRWVLLRGDAGLERFADPTAARWLEAGAVEARRAGCSEDDIERAMRRHSEETFSDTRNFATWAAAERDERLREERDRQRSRLFLEQRGREDAEAQRDHELRRKGLLPPLPRPNWMTPAVEAQ